MSQILYTVKSLIEKIQFTNVQAGKTVDIELAVSNVDFDSSILRDKLKRKVYICICVKVLNLQHPDHSKLQWKYSLSPSVLQFKAYFNLRHGKSQSFTSFHLQLVKLYACLVYKNYAID